MHKETTLTSFFFFVCVWLWNLPWESRAGCFWSEAQLVFHSEMTLNQLHPHIDQHHVWCFSPWLIPLHVVNEAAVHLIWALWSFSLPPFTGQSAYFSCTPVLSCPTSYFHIWSHVEVCVPRWLLCISRRALAGIPRSEQPRKYVSVNLKCTLLSPWLMFVLLFSLPPLVFLLVVVLPGYNVF